eukprot:234757-Pelagomonas_calceolata.AAC.1
MHGVAEGGEGKANRGGAGSFSESRKGRGGHICMKVAECAKGKASRGGLRQPRGSADKRQKGG